MAATEPFFLACRGTQTAIAPLGCDPAVMLTTCTFSPFPKGNREHVELLIADGSVVAGAKTFQSEEHGFKLIVQSRTLTGEQCIGPVTVGRLDKSIKIGLQELEGLLLVNCGPYGGTFDEPLLLDFEVEDRHKGDVVDGYGRARYEASAFSNIAVRW